MMTKRGLLDSWRAFALCILFCALTSADPLTVLVCVPYPEGESGTFLSTCSISLADANTADFNFECVHGGSPDECIAKIESGDAHLTTLDGGSVIRANSDHGIVPLIAEITGDILDGTYYAVAVVHKDFCEPTTTLADLKGTRSCHTGYRKSAGWKIPVGTLLTEVPEFETFPENPEIEDDAELVANFFAKTCAPRTIENGPKNGPEGIGRPWANMCTSCKGDCTTSDQYYDYSGAFRCLMEDRGDVAFVKHTTVLDYALDGQLARPKRIWADKKMEDFRLLCRTGGCAEVTEYETCHLALSPGHALITSAALGYGGEDEETGIAIRDAIMEAAEETDFLEETRAILPNFLWSEGTTGLRPLEKGMEDYVPEASLETYLAFDHLTVASFQGTPTARYCATSDEELEFCERMWEVASGLFPDFMWNCELKRDEDECMRAIADNQADWMTLSPGDAYRGHSRHGLITILAEDGLLGGGYDYYSVAVVKKEFCEDNADASLLDLRGKNSCHTGFRRNAGWDMPVGKLMALNVLEAVKDDPLIENDAETVASFFDETCAPNKDGEGPLRTRKGPTKWDPLCGGCRGSCGSDSPYASYEGAHKCLAEGAGDVAFVKHTTVFDYDDAADLDDLRLLCPASKPGCVAVDEYEECNLGLVPARSVIVRDSLTYTSSFKEVLVNLTANVIFSDLILNEDSNPDAHIFRPSESFFELDDGTEAFLGSSFEAYEALENLATPGGTVVKVCVPFPARGTALNECSALFEAANITGLSFECVAGGSAETCMRQLYVGEAHLTSLDGGDVYRGHHVYGTVPLVREMHKDDVRGTYYGVAVVDKDFCNEDTTLADLQGTRSCHTGYRKMAGWRIPVGTLYAELKEFNSTLRWETVEDDAELVAAFFENTCAPRVSSNGPQNTRDGEGDLWQPLCTGCNGDCTTADQYYDYAGAFRCLMEDSGDVAFVKHTTVPDYALDGRASRAERQWATRNASDFRLLCRTGGCAEIEDYETCHLALAPSHAIVGGAILGRDGQLWDVGQLLRDGLVAATEIPDFFEAAKGFIEDFPFSSSTTELEAINGGYEDYITKESDASLGAFAELVSGDKLFNPGDLATFCAHTPEQYAACEENLDLYQELEPDFRWECVEEISVEACYSSMNRGRVQFMAGSPQEAMMGFQEHGFSTIAAEAVGESKETSVYSLVLVEDESCFDKVYITNFEDADVCFAHYGKDSSWETPLAVMIEQGLLPTVKKKASLSNTAQSTTTFFGEICAPHDPEAEDATEDLCTACEDACGLESDWAGSEGAIACLKEHEGGLAVADSTVLENSRVTGGLQLLCPYKRECQELTDYETCNFGETPTDVLLVQGDAEISYVSRLRSILIEASSKKNYQSILGNTRDSGELVAISSNPELHLEHYLATKDILIDFDD